MKDFRKCEKLYLKCTKLQLDILYFQRCLELRICPKFLLFRPPRLKAYAKLHNIRVEILKNQIQVLRNDLSLSNRKFRKLKSQFCEKLTWLQSIVWITRLNQTGRKLASDTQQRHEQKLLKLWKDQRHPVPDSLINRSNYKLSVEETEALRYGLKHHILPKNINEIDVKSRVEKALYTTKRSSEGEPNILNNSFLENLRHSTVSFINSAKSVCGSNWNKRFHSTIDKLRKNMDIKICSFDKGNEWYCDCEHFRVL